MIITEESPYLPLLHQSVAYIRSLYPEEHAHTFDLMELTSNGARFFVARQDEVIGCVAYIWVDHEQIEIKHMFVLATARGLGCGRALLTAIDWSARMDQAVSIILETSQKQSAAINLYRAFGFVECAPYTAHHSEDVFMIKIL